MNRNDVPIAVYLELMRVAAACRLTEGVHRILARHEIHGVAVRGRSAGESRCLHTYSTLKGPDLFLSRQMCATLNAEVRVNRSTHGSC